MDEKTKNYELDFLIKSEAERPEIIDVLKKHQFSVIGEGQISRIKLAYPIKKELFGYFGHLYFSGEPQNIKELTHDIKTNLKILRFNVISKFKGIEENKPAHIFANRERPEPESYKIRKETTSPIIRKPVKTEALSNEALEKKLEEILK